MDRLSLMDRMRRAPSLRWLPLGELDSLLSRSRVQRFAPGELLIEEGDPGSVVFLIVEGSVAVRMRVSDREQVVIGTRGSGDWVGEMALLDDAPRSASVTAESSLQALCIPQDAFLEVVTRSAPAAVDLLRTVNARLRESDAAQIDGMRKRNQTLTRSNRRLSRENRRLRSELDERFGFESFVGSGRAAEGVREAARHAAESGLPVLLLGETGTGKELVARAIHAASERRDRPLVAVNCALFSENLLESELFGHSRGAFTGATSQKQGLVEAADGGTLFLDEVVDMPPPIQAALLRFLALGEFRRLGETEVRHTDVRVIAATHADLDEALRDGRLRRDLYYRLDVFRIQLPPLRERPEDLAELVVDCSRRVAERLGGAPLVLEPGALEALSAHDFPGNVRELENELERLYAVHGVGARVGVMALSDRIRGTDPAGAASYRDALRAFKVRVITGALQEAGGNRAHAAERLGLHRSNLVRMIRDLEIDVARAADPDASGS
jgi:transcriptional regulator with PAS, ATPase and Fis domain